MNKDTQERKLQFHSPFCCAMELEMRQDQKNLDFQPEKPLNTKPNTVDLLIVKKDAGKKVSSGLGAAFRKYNIVEYKSPQDKMGERVEELMEEFKFKGLFTESQRAELLAHIRETEELEEKLEEQARKLRLQDEAMKQKDEAMKQKDEAMKQKDEAMKRKDEAMKRKDEAMKRKDEAMKRKDEENRRLREMLRDMGVATV